MADYYIQASLGFTCSANEATLLEEAFLAARDWDEEGVTFNPSARFTALFPPVVPAEAWSGLQAIFANPDYPTFGAKIEVEAIDDEPASRRVFLYSLSNFEVGAISELIRRCCQETLKERPIGFEYALSCSKPRTDAFGGGWCVVHPDRIEAGSTLEALAAALRGI